MSLQLYQKVRHQENIVMAGSGLGPRHEGQVDPICCFSIAL